MCTTALLLGTLVVMLRRRFSNKVEPYVLLCHGLRVPVAGDRVVRVALGWMAVGGSAGGEVTAGMGVAAVLWLQSRAGERGWFCASSP